MKYFISVVSMQIKKEIYVADNKKDTRVVLEIHGKIIVVFTGGDDSIKTLNQCDYINLIC